MQRAIVVTANTAHFGDGAIARGPDIRANLPALLGAASAHMGEQGCLIVDGLPIEAVRDQDPPGWQHASIMPWTLYRRDEQLISVGYRHSMDERHFAGLVTPDADPGVLAMALDRYQLLTGTAWRGTHSTTALAGIRESWADARQPLWQLPPMTGKRPCGPLVFRRQLNQFERDWGWVHRFDAKSAYLGALINAEVSYSALVHSGSRVFNRKLPGYWTISLGELARDYVTATGAYAGRPAMVPSHLFVGNVVELTTPMVRLLDDQGVAFQVIDAWLGAPFEHNGRQVHAPATRAFRRWGEQQRDALKLAEHSYPHLVDDVKATYKSVVGAMQREVNGKGMRIRRRDWAHTVIDLWRATLYGKILHVHRMEGVWPVQVVTDSLAYADSSAIPTTLMETLGCPKKGLPAGLSQMRWDESYTTDVWIADHPAKVEATA